jgi:hypothetical protein
MESKKFIAKTIKAESAFEIISQNHYLDEDYALNKVPISIVTPTGLLAVVRLEPSVAGLPSFVIRWDDKQNTIDVDLEGNAGDRDAFRHERNGYRGHHPVTISVEPRVFKVDIQLPKRKVYEALLTFNVGRSVTLAETLQLQVEFSAELLPKDRKPHEG